MSILLINKSQLLSSARGLRMNTPRNWDHLTTQILDENGELFFVNEEFGIIYFTFLGKKLPYWEIEKFPEEVKGPIDAWLDSKGLSYLGHSGYFSKIMQSGGS